MSEQEQVTKVFDDHDSLKKSKMEWFTENGALDSDDVRISTRIAKIIHQRRSKYQDILIFENKTFGRCLALDEAIQCTELDESAYQEMISFLPLNIHHHPKRVLIIGGGDGGVARECAKHSLVEKIVLCEIDQDVVEASRRHLQFMANGFDSGKISLHIQDGCDYVREHAKEFDVIITDSCDPKGPAQTLFTEEYYRSLFECLNPDGLICSQAESYWFELKFIKELYHQVRRIFPSVTYATTSVPSYPSGQIGFLLASKEPNLDFTEPRHRFSDQDCDRMRLKYYSAQMHQASFVLPRFVTKFIEQNK